MAPTADPASTFEKITIPVEGMTCAACQANVQRALARRRGSTRAAVNLMTHEATVDYDPALASPQALVDAVNDTGYLSHLPCPTPDARGRRTARAGAADEYAVLLAQGP